MHDLLLSDEMKLRSAIAERDAMQDVLSRIDEAVCHTKN